MGNSRMVSHDGTVVRVEGDKIQVKIISQSACAECHAKGICTASEKEEKIIDAIDSKHLNVTVGDYVSVSMEERLGWIAILYGFFLPFIVMVTVLFVFNGLGWSEAKAALLGLSSLVPYYLLLYIFRKKIEKDFTFIVDRKHKS